MSAGGRKKDYVWQNVTLTDSFPIYNIPLSIHLFMPIEHVFLAKYAHFKFLPVSAGFCRLKLAGLNRFLPASLNRSGRNQTTLSVTALQYLQTAFLALRQNIS